MCKTGWGDFFLHIPNSGETRKDLHTVFSNREVPAYTPAHLIPSIFPHLLWHFWPDTRKWKVMGPDWNWTRAIHGSTNWAILVNIIFKMYLYFLVWLMSYLITFMVLLPGCHDCNQWRFTQQKNNLNGTLNFLTKIPDTYTAEHDIFSPKTSAGARGTGDVRTRVFTVYSAYILSVGCVKPKECESKQPILQVCRSVGSWKEQDFCRRSSSINIWWFISDQSDSSWFHWVHLFRHHRIIRIFALHVKGKRTYTFNFALNCPFNLRISCGTCLHNADLKGLILCCMANCTCQTFL